MVLVNFTKRVFIITLSITLAMLVCVSSADAFILFGALTGGSAQTNGGTFVKLTPPIGNVGNNNHQSNNLFGFDEDQNILLGSPLAINVGGSSIAAGTTVASHYVFFDPGPSRRAIGHVIFDSQVLGIITSRPNLIASDILANVSANYLSPNLRGLESVDSATINGGNPNRIDIDFRASSPGDYIRVLTAFSPTSAVIPEPASMALMSLGFAGLGFVRRKKNS